MILVPGAVYSIRFAVALKALHLVVQIGLVLATWVVNAALGVRLAALPLWDAVVYALSAATVLSWGLRRTQTPVNEAFPLRRVHPALFAHVTVTVWGASLLLSRAEDVVRSVVPPPAILDQVATGIVSGQEHLWWRTVPVVLVGPVTEELIHRGLLLHLLLLHYPMATAVVVSALIFGVGHLNPWQFVSATSGGLLLAWWRARTGSLWPSLFGHILNNGLSFFVMNGDRITDQTWIVNVVALDFPRPYDILLASLLMASGLLMFWRWSRWSGNDRH